MAKATSGAAADAEFPIHWKEFHPKNFWQCIKACHSMISAVQKHANWIASLKGHLADRTSSGEASSSVKNATWWKSSRTNPQLRMSHHRGSLIPCLGQNHFTAKSQDLEREYPARTTLAQRNPPRKKSHSRTHAGARGWGTQKVEETIGRKCVLQDHPIANLHEGDVLPT
ncbi:uncharacterized protein LOC103791347 isoform X17 [Callithrix jacchus]